MRRYRVNVSIVHRSIQLVVLLFILLGILLPNVSGSVYQSLTMQPYATVALPPVILQDGTAGSSTIYTNDTTAKVSTVAPAPTPTYYPNSYNVATGTYVSGTVPTSAQTVDTNYFIVKSAATSTSPQTLTAHNETTSIGGTTYRQQKLTSADGPATLLTVSAASTGRMLAGKFVYQLTGVSSIPTSTWTIYYRAISSSTAVEAHADVDVLIRQASGSIRTTIGTNVANSGAITTTESTLSGTYAWIAYTVVDQTDYLEIDYFIDVTKSSPSKNVSLRIDDGSLAVADQTRATNIYLPSEHTVSTEFLFSSMTQNTPIQLNFTVVSEYDISSVSVTIQVWNYSASPQAYVNSGQGYDTYSSSGSNQTRYLNITTNPQFYTSNGNAKIKITGVKATPTQYQQKINQVKLVYSYSSSSNYNYVLKIVNNDDDDPWKIRLNAYSETNKERLNNCTIYFRNSSDGTSRQIYIVNGVYVNQTGPWYDLPAGTSTERYIAVTLDASDSQVSYVYVYLEILVPDKTTYAQYVITFEIT